jgi:hypothetical protein
MTPLDLVASSTTYSGISFDLLSTTAVEASSAADADVPA